MSFLARLRTSLVLAVALTALAVSAVVLPICWTLFASADETLAAKNLAVGLNLATTRSEVSRGQFPAEMAGYTVNDETVGLVVIPFQEAEGRMDVTGAQVFGDGAARDLLSESCLEWLGMAYPGSIGDGTLVSEPNPTDCAGHRAVMGVVQRQVGGQTEVWHVIALVDPMFARQHLADVAKGLALASSLAVVLALSLSHLAARAVQRPVRQAAEAAERIGAGERDVQLPVRGRDEFARMSEQFNAATGKLNQTIDELTDMEQRQRRFVADVAHELRTPAATLLASADGLLDPATRDEAATLVVPQARRLAVMTEDLLDLSHIDGGRAELRLDAVDLDALVAAEVAASPLARETLVSGSVGRLVTCDPPRVSLVLRNLLNNAAQHGSGPVLVMVRELGEGVEVAVADQGAGVPDELRSRVFDRFVRGDESRHGRSSGLGLALARENARLHGGDLTLDPDGRTFRLVLPTTPGDPRQSMSTAS